MKNKPNKILLIVIIAVIIYVLVIAVLYFVGNRNRTLLVVTSDPETVELYIDNEKYSTGIEIEIEPGKHKILAVSTGYSAYEREIEVKERQKNIEHIVLEIDTDNEPPEGAPVD